MEVTRSLVAAETSEPALLSRCSGMVRAVPGRLRSADWARFGPEFGAGDEFIDRESSGEGHLLEDPEEETVVEVEVEVEEEGEGVDMYLEETCLPRRTTRR